MTKKAKKQSDTVDLSAKVDELTADLQRNRSDFENYSKRVEVEKTAAYKSGQSAAILKLLPVIDNIERAVNHAPEDLIEHKWVQGVLGFVKQLDKTLADLDLKRIDAKPGMAFNPELHEAIQFDEDAKGEHEVIAEELQAGYLLDGRPVRHAMVKVTRQ